MQGSTPFRPVRRLARTYLRPWSAGAVIGVTAVVVGAYWVSDPPAYGLCVACHARDLLHGALNWAAGLNLTVSPAASQWPLLTVVGLLVGANLGARSSGELRARGPRRPLVQFLLGMLSMLFALIALGCTTRLLLRAAYGDLLAWWALAGVAAGISAATGLLAWHARR